jgi:hypothetical protein
MTPSSLLSFGAVLLFVVPITLMGIEGIIAYLGWLVKNQ